MGKRNQTDCENRNQTTLLQRTAFVYRSIDSPLTLFPGVARLAYTLEVSKDLSATYRKTDTTLTKGS